MHAVIKIDVRSKYLSGKDSYVANNQEYLNVRSVKDVKLLWKCGLIISDNVLSYAIDMK